ncbi:hypothetical protein MNBD_GAMMA15-2211 [hydrothermal vent metagenome]|uniref:C-type lysozyme inhibitor domain-containing protein n=1 Tax=hydrothermal vent metagenome TaxID=652676 RepID=A0A3B0YXE3_9ZZZZ
MLSTCFIKILPGHFLRLSYRYATAGLTVVFLLLTGCARQPVLEPLTSPVSAPSQTWAWECERNFAFVARQEGDAMWLFLPGQAVQLPRIKGEPGNRYHSEAIRFQHQNGKARLELTDAIYEHCRNNVQTAAREHAKLNGVDFRATGNSPDWILDITLDGDMQLVTGADHATLVFATPEPLILENERKTLYTAQNKKHQIIIELVGKPCRNARTGNTRAVTVNISVDERKLKGCGGALH